MLCNTDRETHHLVSFPCSYSIIWQQILGRTSISGNPNMVDSLVQHVKSEDFRSLVLHSILVATVCGIWIERNVRVFQGLSKSVDIVSLAIVYSIKDFLCSRRKIKSSTVNKAFEEGWRHSGSVFSM